MPYKDPEARKQVMSFLANQMKYTATKDELVSFAKAILRLYT